MFVALEGIDGAGKNTLADALVRRAEAAGLTVGRLGFPRYRETAFGALVGLYLDGRFGGLDEVSPYFAAMLYAGDRLQSRELIDATLAANDLVVVDRYVASNIVYNAVKLPPAEQLTFIDRFVEIEHSVFGLPTPDLYLLVDIAPDRAAELVRRKAKRSYTDKAADLHEADVAYLGACRRLYCELADRSFVAPWQVVPVVDAAGELRPPDAIADQAWDAIGRRLPGSDRR